MPQEITQAAINTVPPEELERIFRVDQPYEDAGPPLGLQAIFRAAHQREITAEEYRQNAEAQRIYGAAQVREPFDYAEAERRLRHVTAEEARMMEEEFRRNMARGIQANQTVREDIATQVVEQFKEKKQREAEPEPLDPAFGDHFM